MCCEVGTFSASRVTSMVLSFPGWMNDNSPIDDLLPAAETTAEERERDLRVAKRQELLDHVDFLLRPPARLYSNLETAIELAAEGRLEERIEIDRELCTVSEVIQTWELEELVERAKAGSWGEAARQWW
jgi:hypothetical protein